MKIRLSNTGKRYNREWIFRYVTLELDAQQSYAITGPNGSGKSTLLQTIGGMLEPSEGSLLFEKGGTALQGENIYEQVSFCAPYMEVTEEMTLTEFLRFHNRFKSFLPGQDVHKIIREVGLENAAHKQIRNYSSGMKQRVKLAQAVFADTGVLLLDEPCSNLDAAGIELYHRLISEFGAGRLIIVSSNDEVEYGFCTGRIDIQNYK
jgi:ABC-type multidrug transport system ATPase subunit